MRLLTTIDFKAKEIKPISHPPTDEDRATLIERSAFMHQFEKCPMTLALGQKVFWRPKPSALRYCGKSMLSWYMEGLAAIAEKPCDFVMRLNETKKEAEPTIPCLIHGLKSDGSIVLQRSSSCLVCELLGFRLCNASSKYDTLQLNIKDKGIHESQIEELRLKTTKRGIALTKAQINLDFLYQEVSCLWHLIEKDPVTRRACLAELNDARIVMQTDSTRFVNIYREYQTQVPDDWQLRMQIEQFNRRHLPPSLRAAFPPLSESVPQCGETIDTKDAQRDEPVDFEDPQSEEVIDTKPIKEADDVKEDCSNWTSLEDSSSEMEQSQSSS